MKLPDDLKRPPPNQGMYDPQWVEAVVRDCARVCAARYTPTTAREEAGRCADAILARYNLEKK